MESADTKNESRMLSLLSVQGAFANIGWNMASPSVVLTYIAVAQDVPVFLAGLLITVRRIAYMAVDVFGGTFVETTQNSTRSMALADIMLAVFLLIAILSILSGSPLAITVALVAAMFGIGAASELQNILFNNFIGKTMHSESRTRMRYWAMGLGGVGTIMFAWPVHLLMSDAAPVSRHSTIVLIATGCFVMAGLLITSARRFTLAQAAPQQAQPKAKRNWKGELRKLVANYRLLAGTPWFRRFMAIRLSLQSVELALPFFAILAAFTNEDSARGITALIISSAIAVMVAGPLWRALSHVSNRAVLATGCVLAAVAGLTLVANHFLQLVGPTYLHAAALFIVTIASKGVVSARSLYFLDIAPDEQRVAGLTVSKSLVRIAAITFSALLAAVAHMQHVVWAILAIALLNLATAALCSALVKQAPPVPQPA